MKRQKTLTWFRAGYNQTALIFPFVVAAPRFFSGSIKLGGLMQTASAFGQVQEALSWFVNAYAQIAEWKATVDRLTGFRNACHRAQAEAQSGAGVTVAATGSVDVIADDVRIDLPHGQPLLALLDLELASGQSVLVTGPSGSGKSTLFRAIAGIWPFGRGTVWMPRNAHALFLPQKPYLTIGRLREQLCYPAATASADDHELRGILEECGLGHMVHRLDEEQHWAQQLSGGEQQRVAFARALVQKPDWLFMDEATSALDEASEAQLYRLLQAKLPQTTVISIGHRSTLGQFHQGRLEFRSNQKGANELARVTDLPASATHAVNCLAREAS